MVGLVVLAIVLVGAGTAVVAWTRAASTTERHVADQTRAMAVAFEDAMPYLTRPAIGPGRLERLQRSLDLEEIGLVLVPRDGGPLHVLSGLPDVVSEDDLRPLAEHPAGPDQEAHASGFRGEVAWAAAVVPLAPDAVGPAIVVVATRRAVDPLAGTYRWMLLGALASIVVSVLVALRLSRSLARPVVDVAAAAHRIADGRLDTRLDPHPGQTSSRRTDEVSELVAAVNAMAEGLERSRGLERQFLLSISHDLRTPMTSIRGYAEGLADGTVTDTRRAGEVVLAEATRLDRLVRDLLDLARLDARQFTLDPVAIDVASATVEVVHGFGPAAQEADITLTVVSSDDGDTSTARIDHDRWSQVVGNLVENGLRYAASSLTVTIQAIDGWVEVRVADDGPGIAAADLPHVFERLYVAEHRPADRESGSGLGLAIVRELVEAMDGEVRADASSDGGTVMVVRVPSVGEE